MTKADVISPPLERAPQLNALATPQFLCLLAIFLLLQGSGTLVRQTLSHCSREHFERYSNSLGGSTSESELTHAPPLPLIMKKASVIPLSICSLFRPKMHSCLNFGEPLLYTAHYHTTVPIAVDKVAGHGGAQGCIVLFQPVVNPPPRLTNIGFPARHRCLVNDALDTGQEGSDMFHGASGIFSRLRISART